MRTSRKGLGRVVRRRESPDGKQFRDKTILSARVLCSRSDMRGRRKRSLAVVKLDAFVCCNIEQRKRPVDLRKYLATYMMNAKPRYKRDTILPCKKQMDPMPIKLFNLKSASHAISQALVNCSRYVDQEDSSLFTYQQINSRTSRLSHDQSPSPILRQEFSTSSHNFKKSSSMRF